VDDILRRLGQRIRELRVQRGFKSQEEFADYCGLHRTFVGHLETGRKDFRLSTLIRVAEILQVTLAQLFSDVETEDQQKSAHQNRASAFSAQNLLREIGTLERSVRNLRKIAGLGILDDKKPRKEEPQ
jgi:transcriptional regulator with XRE-family HTH domain